ncbi:MAG: T9SS type A sorting domain-containing protein [Saprospiraceae bacterium]|nr:T9SS type A sorting domain-containing protein [Saprospiraceae bacterium]
MNKNKFNGCLIMVFLLAQMLTLQAQIQLNASNSVPIVGDAFTLQGVDSLSLVHFETPQPGPNQQWDFSDWTSSAAPYQLIFIPPSATPNDSSFTSSTLASVDMRDTSFAYYEVNNQGWKKTGISSSFLGSAPYARPQLQMQFPATLGSSLQVDSFQYELFIALFGFNLSVKGIDSLAVIGSGSLKLPDGVNYSNVLCVIRITHESDELGVFGVTNTSSVRYEFYDGIQRYPVMVVTNTTTDGFGTNGLSAFILKNAGTLSSTATALQAEPIHLYPNPACNFLQLNGLEFGTLQIFDAIGQLKFSSNAPVPQIDVQQFPNGKYYLSTDGKYRASFMVAH